MASKYTSNFKEIKKLCMDRTHTLFEAKSFKDNKNYSIKKIPFSYENQDKVMKEIEILGKLKSQYIIEFHAYWIENNYYLNHAENLVEETSNLYDVENQLLLHIQMELCNKSLDEYITDIKNDYILNTISKEEYFNVCNIFLQLLKGVDYLHSKNQPIIHRDLKPENIFLVGEGENYKVKITGFGLSTYQSYNSKSHTKDAGTPNYKAPETSYNRYNVKVDIYSLGVIMKHLFNMDINSYTNNNVPEINRKYENAKETCVKCIDVLEKNRPTCAQLIEDAKKWLYE